MIEALIQKCFEKCNLKVNEKQINDLSMLTDLTLEKNQLLNLTSINDEEKFIDKMIVDSALLFSNIDLNNKYVLDLGTGAGFPGLVLAILSPHTKFVLLDSTTKKINHIQEVAQKIGLNNVEMVSARAEEYIDGNREKFDLVVARAVKELPILLEIAVPFVKNGGNFLAYKGQNYLDEINKSKRAIKLLNCSFVQAVSYTLPISKETRYYLIFSKTASTDLKYPRQYSKIIHKPL